MKEEHGQGIAAILTEIKRYIFGNLRSRAQKYIPKQTEVVLVSFYSISNIYRELGAVVQEWEF
jgi:hypothetical protein